MPANLFYKACTGLLDRSNRSSGKLFNFKVGRSLPAALILSVSFSKIAFAHSIDRHEVSAFEQFRTVTGNIQGSLYQSARKAGVSASVIQQFETIFRWQLDFNKDLRAGDRFELLIDDSPKNSQGFGGDILAARLYQKNKTYTAVRHSDGKYYTPEGQLLGSSFSRYPLGIKSQVSSGFNPARKHPITGQIRPHRGTDWAVPVGTAVYAPADGAIVKAKTNHPAAGTFIEMQHGKRYVTRYLHLSQLNVQEGQQVRKGDVIGKTGNTGLSTGPHLHYELFIDGRAVDVMTAKLPNGKPLRGEALKQFKIATQPIIAAMNQNRQELLLASKETSPDDNWLMMKNRGAF